MRPQTGDGAGVLIQIPHAFFEGECSRLGFPLPSPGEYGVGMVFLPVEPHERLQCEAIVEEIVRDEGLTVLGWRDTPVNANTIGRLARSTQPYIEQFFVKRAYGMDEDALERKLYVIRKRAEKEVAAPICGRRASSTFPRFPAARLFTRACCWPRRLPTSTWSCRIPKCGVAFVWSTSASPPTRSPPGISPIPTATFATTAKSTRCAAM